MSTLYLHLNLACFDVFVASLEMFSRRRGLSEKKCDRNQGKLSVLRTCIPAVNDTKCLQGEICYTVNKLDTSRNLWCCGCRLH